MTEEEFINNQLQALSKSKFRTGFKLKEKEKEYIKASKTEANRIIDEARRKAQKDKEELIANTKEEIISVALLAAKKVVAKNIDENQEKALFDDLIKKVGDA